MPSATMSGVTVRHSRLSRYSSTAMILLGVFTFLFVSGFYGLILTFVGVLMFWFYRRQERRAQALSGSKPGSPG